ncbi:hypothetical protein F5878DRAFT_718411 [Lentinula raphanica]|uniref:Uncharacterized protein n=1 Tax=Lentinula raphanica TaxID=153919 RepID=A0AA38UBG3_9AGAR|nr:hypothetical protein F5878DRAFT_718411 [Lentinula raphanica]
MYSHLAPDWYNWHEFVLTDAFDQFVSRSPPSNSGDYVSHDRYNLLEDGDNDNTTSIISIDSSVHGVPKLEAYMYYNGVRGGKRGPKLIYRTSTDVLPFPFGPFQYVRLIQLLTVHEHAKLSKDNLWSKIRDQTVQLLDDKQIKFTSIDLVRFRWEDCPMERTSGEIVTSSVTIWIGVLPDSTNGDAAFNSAQDIINLLKQHDINDIDVAFRESVVQPLTQPILYAPVDDLHPLKKVIDWLTTPLSLPIAGMKTRDIQGALGLYFKVGDDLYGVTARHVLFPDTEGNELYRYDTTLPKKNVILMGDRAFDDLLASVTNSIGFLKRSLDNLKERIKLYTAKATGGDQEAAEVLVRQRRHLDIDMEIILSLKRFYATLRMDWANVNNRVIGHVVWSPPITGLNPPHGYAQDVCVIKLDKDKFLPNFRGNVIDLGTQIEMIEFMMLIRPQRDAPSKLIYPLDCLYQLKDILAAAKFKKPNNKDKEGDPTRFVFKRGPSTLTTIGRLNGFESYERRYSLLGHFDSVQAAVYPHDKTSGLFSSLGDSGAAIVGTDNDFVAQLNAGTGSAGDSCDIIYGTPMEWLWTVIQAEFPNAVLFFDDPAPN